MYCMYCIYMEKANVELLHIFSETVYFKDQKVDHK